MEEKFLKSDFTVIVDTREQRPWLFEGLTKRVRGHDVELLVPTVRKCLKSGDYSILGYEDRVAIERKSAADLISTIAHGRERFTRELDRLSSFRYSVIIIESEWKAVQQHCADKTEMSPVSLDSSILAFMQRYPTDWIYRPTVFDAAKTAYKVLDRFYRDTQDGKREEAG